ncbi:MAG: APC family permease [Candidatus Dependentiae bacterium]|nr:APC family permease [Candidatus Dependentiae bacterium]
MSISHTQEYKLSLPAAVLININIMLGAGIFINTPELAKQAGMLGAFNYLIVGVLMLPLILSIAQLLRLHPAGGFYTFAQKEINPFIGFLSGWSYFTSKLASSMLMIHVSVTLLQLIIPSIAWIHPFALDTMVVCLFSALNMLNMKAGSTIQTMFIGFKTIPIFFAILSGIFLFQTNNFIATTIMWDGIYTSLPLVIYAVIGFEAACSMSSKIKDAHKNAPLAVLISFGIVISIAFLYQALFYGALGTTLTHVDYRGAFPALLHALFGDSLLTHKLAGLLHIAIASSTLGAAYGIIFSNSWNLHILAQHHHIIGSRFFTKLNSNFIPFACVLVEGALCLMYLIISQGNHVPLQQIGALGCVIAYTLSVIALLHATRNNPATTIKRWIPMLGLVSCAILMTACINSFFVKGMSSLIVYSLLIAFGIGMYKITLQRAHKQ